MILDNEIYVSLTASNETSSDVGAISMVPIPLACFGFPTLHPKD
jgi:hypothetical protein